MKVELFDRHAENVDPNVPLCVHDSYDGLIWGDTFKTQINMEVPGWLVTSKLMKAEAEVEIHFKSKKHVVVIVNHPDYLTAMRALQQQESNEDVH